MNIYNHAMLATGPRRDPSYFCCHWPTCGVYHLADLLVAAAFLGSASPIRGMLDASHCWNGCGTMYPSAVNQREKDASSSSSFTSLDEAELGYRTFSRYVGSSFFVQLEIVIFDVSGCIYLTEDRLPCAPCSLQCILCSSPPAKANM